MTMLETILGNQQVVGRHKKRVYDLLISLREKAGEKNDVFLELEHRVSVMEDPGKSEVLGLIYSLRAGLKKGTGIAIVLGYDSSMKEYVRPLRDDAMFKHYPMSIHDEGIDQRLYGLCNSKQHDGAVLVSRDGCVIDNSINLEVNPGQILDDYGIPNDMDLSERFGFKQKLGTRHTSAKAASFVMPDATIFVLSEESGNIRIFERGRTVYSPIKEEIQAMEPAVI